MPRERVNVGQQILWWIVALAFAGGTAALLETGRARLFVQIFAASLVLAGAATIFYGWRAKLLARQSEAWLPVEAQVVSAKLETTASSSDARNPGLTYFRPCIEYEYYFEGKTRRSDRVLFADVNFPREEGEKLIAQHPAGSRFRAYVDPAHPDRAVMERGDAVHQRQYFIPFLAGGMFVIFGVALWFLAPLVR